MEQTTSTPHCYESERLALRRARLNDIPHFHAIMSNAASMEFWSTPPHTSVEQTSKWVKSMVNAYDVPNAEGKIPAPIDLVIEEKLTGVVIGKMGLYKLPEIGFIFHPAYWGKGYASEALTLMLKVIWDLRPELSHIDADVDPRNWRSLRLLKRFGFVEIGRREKTFETHLGWCDSVDLRLTRPMMK